jgi:hypothetical protein
VGEGLSGASPRDESGWTIETYSAHNEALRAAEARFQDERDRRYAEVDIEKEKALKIKETADLAALGLAREIQTYKDEKANELRSQIERERGNYATRSDLVAMGDKFEAQLKPISEYVVGQQGGPRAITSAMLFSALFVGIAVIGVIVALANYFASH